MLTLLYHNISYKKCKGKEMGIFLSADNYYS